MLATLTEYQTFFEGLPPDYAALEVPELWRYSGQEVSFYALVNEPYFAAPHTRLFPFLTPAVWLRSGQRGAAAEVIMMAHQFRAWGQASEA